MDENTTALLGFLVMCVPIFILGLVMYFSLKEPKTGGQTRKGVSQMKWMSTAYGNKIIFDEAGNVTGNIVVKDISHHLAGINRYAGGLISVKKPGEPGFYSVAEHSILISSQVSDKAKPYALMHDAAEAYIGDIIRPIKTDDQRVIEDKIMDLIIKKFDINVTNEIKKEVKHADNCMIASEWFHFKRAYEKEFLDDHGLTEKDRLPVVIRELEPLAAKQLFMSHFRCLVGGDYDN